MESHLLYCLLKRYFCLDIQIPVDVKYFIFFFLFYSLIVLVSSMLLIPPSIPYYMRQQFLKGLSCKLMHGVSAKFMSYPYFPYIYLCVYFTRAFCNTMLKAENRHSTLSLFALYNQRWPRILIVLYINIDVAPWCCIDTTLHRSWALVGNKYLPCKYHSKRPLS